MRTFFKECDVKLHQVNDGVSSKIYILSDDKIEVGDWILRPSTNYLGQVFEEDGRYFYCSSDRNRFTMKDGCKKIVGTNNNDISLFSIPDDFITEYFKHEDRIDKVLVSYEEIDWNFTTNREQLYYGYEVDLSDDYIKTITRPKVVNGSIIIQSIENKILLGEGELFKLFRIGYEMGCDNIGPLDMKDWFKNYLKSLNK